MPTAPLDDLVEEMAETLRAVVAGESEFEVQVTSIRNYSPTPPSLDIYEGDPLRDDDSAGFGQYGGQYFYTVRARVVTVDNPAGQRLLRRFMDDRDAIGIAPALMDDQTLNGLASSVKVEGPTGQIHYADPDPEGRGYLGCEWRVRVLRAYS